MCFVLSASALAGCGKDTAVKKINTGNYSEKTFADESVSDGTVCENQRYALEWESDYGRVSITDKQTGRVYSTTPEEAREKRFDEDGIIIRNNPQIDSPVIVYYYDPATLEEKNLLAYNSAVTDGYVYTQQIENGIKVIYDFAQYEIAVPVEFTIDENGFYITVRPEEITDNGEYIVTGVAIAPFLCALKNGTADSYLFIPDGSGTLVEPVETDIIGSQGSLEIYGNDLTVQTYDYKSVQKQVNMPVYGMKKGESALFAIISSGASQASLEWNVGSQNIGFSSVYPFFRIRGYSLVESPAGFAASAMEIKIFDEAINTTPLTVSYTPLYGEKAGYVGMAEVYRNYLTETAGLEKNDKPPKTATLKILGGIQRKAYAFGIPYTRLEALTTLEQAYEIAEYIGSETGNGIVIDLVGFGKSGIDVGKAGGGFTVSGTLGSAKDLKKLDDFCKDSGIDMFMDFDLIGFNKSGCGFSAINDAAKLPNGQNVYLFCYDTVTRKQTTPRYQLLSRTGLTSAAEKMLEYAGKSGLNGIALDSLSHVSYSDYANPAYSVCGQIGEDIQGIYKKISEEGYRILSNNANDYAAALSDHITDVATSSSAFNISGNDIPFYQIVFRGYVPMSSEPVNLAADSNMSILKCAESGISPSYSLIYNYSNELVTSKYSETFGGNYRLQKEEIAEQINAFSDYYEKIGTAVITDHEILGNGLRVTTFDNGVKAVVNFSGSELFYGDISCAAESYIVVEA